jgi:hypothetical protein
MDFVFYDLETNGISLEYDQRLQFAANGFSKGLVEALERQLQS